MNIKYFFKTNKYTKNIYPKIYDFYYRRKYLTGKYSFVNRSRECSKLCVVLAGYKEYMTSSVMGRLKKYVPDDIDVCVITSGKWSDSLAELCKKNKWSYLSTKRNNVSLAQNIAIDLHKKAKYIYKMDEDIFLTEKYFEKMMSAYKKAASTNYNCGVMAPLLPINGYGHVRIIEEFKMKTAYESRFGELKIAGGADRPIESDPDLAKFMWGEKVEINGDTYSLPSIDEMNTVMGKKGLILEACPIRFSIGSIMFERKLWKDMDYFHVSKGNDMGKDEIQICEYCMLNSRPLLVCNNIVVGHLSFGKQNETMKKYYLDNESKFMAPEGNV